MRLKILILLPLLYISICYADIYKWTDENGQVHYGERPKSENSEKIDINPATPNLDPGLDERREKQQRLLDTYAEERAEKKQKQAEATEKKLEMQKKCVELKDYLRGLKEASGIYNLDEEGNRVILDEEAHQKEITDIQEFMSKNCK